MFLTIQKGPGKSVTGTDGPGDIETDAQLPTPRPPGSVTPVYPTIPYDDARRGRSGGRLFNCPPAMRVGTVVFAAPSPYREVVEATSAELGPVLGVLVAKSAPTIGEVVELGPADVFEDLTPGARYFLSEDGNLVAPPLEPAYLPYVHYIGQAVAARTLMVQPSYPLLKTSAP